MRGKGSGLGGNGNVIPSVDKNVTFPTDCHYFSFLKNLFAHIRYGLNSQRKICLAISYMN